MVCLRQMSQKHNIAIITIIHQPNSDIIMMFDKLYVLAKGGVCVYFGSPQNLNSFLNECEIKCKEFQIPIEVLIKVAINSINNEQVLKMVKKTTKENQKRLNRCLNETELFPDGIPFKSKIFKPIDMWHLLLRTMTCNYISQWKSLLIQFILFVTLPLILKIIFNPNIGIPDGCYSFLHNHNISCSKQLENDSLLDQNIKFLFFISTLAIFIQLTVTTLTFPFEVKIFINEHRNSKQIDLNAIILHKYFNFGKVLVIN